MVHEMYLDTGEIIMWKTFRTTGERKDAHCLILSSLGMISLGLTNNFLLRIVCLCK